METVSQFKVSSKRFKELRIEPAISCFHHVKSSVSGSSPHHMSIPDPAALGPGAMADLGGGATGGFEFETHSTMNQYPQSIYGK